jgi:putative peptidoglycan lipid II flippase
MLPQGMFSVAVATVLFPTLARLASRGDLDRFRETVSMGMRQIAFLLVPASVAFAVLADPIVRVVYQRGDFTPAQVPATADALAAFSLGLAFNGFMLMLNRAFFSLQSPWIPTWVALGNLALNGVLDAAFYRFGIWGIPLSTSIVNIAGTAALVVLLDRRLGHLDLRRTLDAVIRVIVASAVLGAISYGTWKGLHEVLGGSFLAALLALAAALTVGIVGYLVSARLLRVRELDTLLGLRPRFR